MFAIILLAKSRYGHVPYRSLELDERMCSVVIMCRKSFAVGAEIGVVAHRTLVAITDNIGILVCAKRAIAMDTVMTLETC